MKPLRQIRKEVSPTEKKYMSWNNNIAKANEGTMSSGIFDDDKVKAKDAARKFAMFLKKNRNITVDVDEKNPNKDSKDLEAYTSELMNYVFDDQMLDDLDPKRNKGKNANAIVTARLKKLGVKIR